jgi:hypothetical protein
VKLPRVAVPAMAIIKMTGVEYWQNWFSRSHVFWNFFQINISIT